MKRVWKILVVDDDDGNIDNLAEMIRIFAKNNQLLVSVSTAYDGSEVIGMDMSDVDIIFTDLQMPKMNGDLAAFHLRNNGYQKEIIAITGEPKLIKDAYRECFSLVLTKPVGMDKFFKVLEKAIAVGE